jgi:hypothetical protein
MLVRVPAREETMNENESRDPSARPPQLGSLAKSAGLGSLAQAARSKQLRQARGLLIGIGVLTIIVNAIAIGMVRDQAKKAIDAKIAEERKNVPAGMELQIDPVKVKELEDQVVRVSQLIGGALIALGVLYIIFGIVINRYPVPVTIISLVLFVGVNAVFAVIEPKVLVQGVIWKILIIVVLVKAIQSAVAYEKERSAAALESA